MKSNPRALLLVLAAAVALLLAPSDTLRVFGAALLLLALPGIAVASRFATDATEVPPYAFILSLALLVPVAGAGYAAGLSVAAVRWLYVATALTLTGMSYALPHRTRLPGDSPTPAERPAPFISGPAAGAFALAAAWALLAFLLGPHQLSATSDSISLVAVVRRLLSEPSLAPITSLVDRPNVDMTSLSYNVWLVAAAVITDLARVDVIRTWIEVPALMAPLMLLAYYGFVHALFEDSRIALVAAVILFLVQGVFFPMETQVLGFRNRVGDLAGLVALGTLFRYLRDGRRSNLLLTALAGAVAVHVYLGALLYLVLAIGFFGAWMLVFERDLRAMRRMALALAAIVLLSAPYIALILPYYMSDHAIISEVVRPHADKFLPLGGMRIADPASVVWGLGGAAGWRFWSVVVGLAAIPFLWVKRRSLWAAFFLAQIIGTALILFNPLLVELALIVVLPGKMVKYLPQIATIAGIPLLAYGAWRVWERWATELTSRRAVAIATAVLALVLLFGGLRLRSLAETAYRNQYPGSAAQGQLGETVRRYLLHRGYPSEGFLGRPPALHRDLSNVVEPGSVVASVTLQIPAFAHVYLPPAQGLEEMRQIFDPQVPVHQMVSLLRSWDVDYLVAHEPTPDVAPAQLFKRMAIEPSLQFGHERFEEHPAFFEPVYVRDGWRIYRFHGAPVERAGGA